MVCQSDVSQGDNLLAILFNLLLNELASELKTKVTIHGQHVYIPLYADDIVLLWQIKLICKDVILCT